MSASTLGYVDLAILAVFIFAVCLAAIEDVRVFRIPNWASAIVAVAFLPYAALHLGLWDVGMHLAIAVTIFAITATFWKLRFIGGGDVKLLSAVGLWLGLELAFPFMLVMTGVSVVIAVVLLVIRRFSWVVYSGVPVRPMLRMVAIAETGKCPYALPIAIAALTTIPQKFL